MKFVLLAFWFLCTCAFLNARFVFNERYSERKYDDNARNVKSNDVVGDSHTEKRDSSKAKNSYVWENVLDDFTQDFDMGDGNFIGVRSFDEIQEPISKEQRKANRAARKAARAAKAAKEAAILAKFFEASERQETDFTDEDGDYTKHDCLTIKPYTEENWYSEEWNKGLSAKKFIQKKGNKTYLKYNSAYGIPMIGTAKFKDESMVRGCYLIRYIFADNQHLRIGARRRGMYNLGFKGGVCCPAQMGNNGLSCGCNGKFPSNGKGAPAHEMAHFWIGRIFIPMVEDGRLTLPEYINQDNAWEFNNKPFNDNTSKSCNRLDKPDNKPGVFGTWIWNVQMLDKIRGKSGIHMCKTHHFMIYSGQQNWLFKGNEKVIKKSRPCFYEKSANLYNLMAKIWPCSNTYVPVCKDAAKQFKLGAAQRFKIGKVDPNDPDISKMVCEVESKVNVQVQQEDLPPFDQTKEDLAPEERCNTVAQRVNKQFAPEIPYPTNAFVKYLNNDQERAWFWRRCCAKTLNFDNSVPYVEDPDFKVTDGTCTGENFDADDDEKMNEDDNNGDDAGEDNGSLAEEEGEEEGVEEEGEEEGAEEKEVESDELW